LFFAHLVALLIISAFVFIGSLLLYKLTALLIPLRVTDNQELVGLDLSQHAESVYKGQMNEPAINRQQQLFE
jgi:Amt family ammonium transporter